MPALTPAKGLTQPDIGSDGSGVWGGYINANLSLLDTALGGTLSLSLSGSITLTTTQIENTGFEFTGTISSEAEITWPSRIDGAGFHGLAVIQNGTTGGHPILCVIAGGTPVTGPRLVVRLEC
jgi:hypothetical protein